MDYPRNTASRDEMELAGLTAIVTGNFDIEGQERQGQADLLRSTALPTERQGDFESLGFTFGEVNPADPMFQQATLPPGWKREGSDHAMWSYIADERGINRVAVFYKAAFYDRRAHAHIIRVGFDVASKHIYGDAPTFQPPAGLTEDERADAVSEARAYIESAAEYPDIYGDRLPRAQQILAQFEVAS